MKQAGFRQFLGLSSGYILLITSYLLGASGFGIFFAFLLEILALLIIYTIFRVKDERANPMRYRKQQPVFNLYITIIPFLMVQYLLIWLVLNQVSDRMYIPSFEELLAEWQNWLIIAYLVVFYFLRYRQLSTQHPADYARNRFVVSILLFTAINAVGVILTHLIQRPDFLIVLISMSFIRIVIEYFLNKKFDLYLTQS